MSFINCLVKKGRALPFISERSRTFNSIRSSNLPYRGARDNRGKGGETGGPEGGGVDG